MKTYVSLLRGINVSGQKLIKMDVLKMLCVELGFEEINTYIQSGNIVFQAKESPSKSIEKRLHDVILKHFGFDVEVFCLEKCDFTEVLKNNPFPEENLKEKEAIYVTFLESVPVEEKVNLLMEKNNKNEEISYHGKCIYQLCRNGFAKSVFTNQRIEKSLLQKATTRNLTTVKKLFQILVDPLGEFERKAGLSGC